MLVFVGGDDVVLGWKLRVLVVPGGDSRLRCRSGRWSVSLLHRFQQSSQYPEHLSCLNLVFHHSRLDIIDAGYLVYPHPEDPGELS